MKVLAATTQKKAPRPRCAYGLIMPMAPKRRNYRAAHKRTPRPPHRMSPSTSCPGIPASDEEQRIIDRITEADERTAVNVPRSPSRPDEQGCRHVKSQSIGDLM